ncbi:HLA class II histocompatibility antigen, DM alpha chain isoform X3 [Otolemur garnettii]|uniref:HLA class II histocompatibility antigen, DM alpha chain isoform X3 n=1 Tax=Otolemur garnettii TaxID=30611 RepID=UPI000C7EAC6B|nr:HLA class II histocompatibility antigen, DM alpha chain isoform X3 [Otolemur garnettii]
MAHGQSQGAALLQLLQLLWLLPHSEALPEAPTPRWRDELQNHTFLHTVYCQYGSPSVGLSESYDEDQLFSFDFLQNTRVPRLPEFANWAQEERDASAIFFDKTFCQDMIQDIGPQLEGKIPVSRVPQNPLPSDLLENVLCGIAFGLGVLGIIVGTVLILYFRKPCSGD